ncbi:MAG: 2Fe-2S iron-sulfur cluster binding domain-containing protein [Flavobacteriales bacterium]
MKSVSVTHHSLPKLIVHHRGETRCFSLEPHANILGFLRRKSLDVPYSCLSGRCGSCKAKRLRGHVSMRHTDGLGSAEIADGYILLCQSLVESEEVEVSLGD